jgi:hypothetical protein
VTQSKVVQIAAPESAAGRRDRADRRTRNSVPPILHSVRQTSRKKLAELLQSLFNNADDALFEMADRSRNDLDQNMYFDSMRELRLHRKRIGQLFIENVNQGFDEIYAAEKLVDDGTTANLKAAEAEDMALLEKDELEISVAVSGIVSKITSQFSLPIMQLTKRVDSICDAQSITERLNPLGPQQLTEAFVKAVDGLDLEIKVRIIVLKLFERFVMEQLGDVFVSANKMLAEAGVLTDLRNVMKKSRSQSPLRRGRPRRGQSSPDRGVSYALGGIPDADPAETGEYGEVPGQVGGAAGHSGGMPGQGDGGFGFLQDLLAQVRGGPENGPVDGSGSGGAGSASLGSGPILSTDDIVSVLSRVQNESSIVPIDIDHVPVSVDLRNLVTARALEVTGEKGHGMEQADDDTVNLVGMLFDYILNDRNLAIPMKALIGRLQIPMLKVGILDKSFFSQTSHPARQLLNELSSAGIGWSSSTELKRDALYNKIESVVLRVLNGFTDDVNDFVPLIDELRDFVTRDRHRSQIVEQRVKESESGRAKTLSAKQRVERLINQKASGLRLSPDVGHFISDVWARVLVYLCVKQGSDSSEWISAVSTFDDLLWSVQPLDTMEDIETRDRGLPDLLDRLEAGMELINLPRPDVDESLEQVALILEEVSENDRAYMDDDGPATEAPTQPVMEEIVLTVPGERLDEAPFEPDPEVARDMKRFTEGAWVEMSEDGGDATRCKIAAIIKPGHKYIFVNRRGMKVAEKSRTGLADAMKNGTVRLLDESQVFDRALEAVIGNLRQMHRQPAPAS